MLWRIVSNLIRPIWDILNLVLTSLSIDRECALVCQAERYRFYLTLSAHVADGTLCRPGSNDRCIEGQCRVGG